MSSSAVVSSSSTELRVRDVNGHYRPAGTDEVLQQAERVLSQRLQRGEMMSSPAAVKDCLRDRLGVFDCGVFIVIFLDAQHRILALEEMLRGTLTQTAFYPREVVKAALAHNAGAVFPAHNRSSSGSSCSTAWTCPGQGRSRWRSWGSCSGHGAADQRVVMPRPAFRAVRVGRPVTFPR